MLPVSNTLNYFENFEWQLADHPMGMMMGATLEEQQTLESFDFFDYPLLLQDHGIDGGQGEYPPLNGAGSGGDHDLQLLLTKKRKNHNESERDRRKKINGLYSSLRALLPAADHTKKLSIPATVARVLKYIEELQKEVEDLTHKKEELLSKAHTLQGDDQDEEEKPRKKSRITKDMNKSSSMCSVSIDKVEEKEIAIHISTSQRIASMSEVLLLLDNCGFLVIHVSCFQSFGGRSFYHLHLAMEGTKIIEHETLKEKLSILIDKHVHASHDPCGQARGIKHVSDFGIMENPSMPNNKEWQIESLKYHGIVASPCPLVQLEH